MQSQVKQKVLFLLVLETSTPTISLQYHYLLRLSSKRQIIIFDEPEDESNYDGYEIEFKKNKFFGNE